MVSIVIPIYNVEKYIHECVDSVINQTYKDLEIILVDDGSPDNCGKICDEYAKKDSRIKVIHKENGGLSDARNAGMEASTGEYIYFLDSDDYISLDAIDKLVTFISEQNADMIFFNAYSFADDYTGKLDTLIWQNLYPTCSGKDMLDLRFRNNEVAPSVPLHFYTAEFINNHSLRFKKGIVYEDWLFSVIAYLRAGKVGFLNDVLYYRRMRQNSIMTSSPTICEQRSYWICIQEYIEEKRHYPENSLEAHMLEKFIKYTVFLILNQYCMLTKQDRVKSAKEFYKLKNVLDSLTSLNCQKLKLKLSHPTLWRIYHYWICKCQRMIEFSKKTLIKS